MSCTSSGFLIQFISLIRPGSFMDGGNDSQEEGGGSGDDSPRKVGVDVAGQPMKKKVKIGVSGLPF